MNTIVLHRALLILFGLSLLFLVILIINVLIVKYNGKPVPVPVIPRGAQTLGEGKPLIYVVIGDSTAVGQGGEYSRGIARSSAELLARNHKVKFYNLGVSGARISDIKQKQLPKAISLRPNVVLLSAGANDVTHLTPIGDVMRDTSHIIDKFRKSNPAIKIILTGAPAMGSVSRFPWLLRHFAKLRTNQMNAGFERLSKNKMYTLVPLAAKTGSIFSRRPELFSQDKFHPNTSGYDIWARVINESIGSVHTPQQ